jgi:uncharacterized protein (TIGR02284 family)
MVQIRATTINNFIKEIKEMKVVVDLLNDLIAANLGIVDVYQTAAKHLENEVNIALLYDYAQQHETFVTELGNLVVSYNNTPVTSADSDSLIKQAWVTLKAVVTEGDAPILTAVTRDAEDILAAYREAMRRDLPDDVCNLIRNHMSNARITHKKLALLCAAYS